MKEYGLIAGKVNNQYDRQPNKRSIMLCYFCYNNGIAAEAIALAAQDFAERDEGNDVYKFYPVCWEHLSTWNNGATEKFQAYYISTLDNVPHRLTYDKRDSHS